MIKINQAIIVEGKYDKIKLESIVDALIIPTDGFAVFKDTEKQKFIRRLADEKGILILTDSDSAGFMIRSFIGKTVSSDKVFHAYIPDIFGKEKRKSEYSKEGKLGVEGVNKEIIIGALEKSGIAFSENGKTESRKITHYDLYYYGLSGKPGSKEKRETFLEFISLPVRLSSSSFVKALNMFMTYEEFCDKIKECFGDDYENRPRL